MLLLLSVFTITGCGNTEREDKELKEDNQKETEATNKALECTYGCADDDVKRT